jgi:hypothetical protein
MDEVKSPVLDSCTILSLPFAATGSINGHPPRGYPWPAEASEHQDLGEPAK